MEHHLNVNIATQFDVDTALFIQNLKHWTLKNLANKKHIHDGLCWSYDTLEALGDIFPYWSSRQLQRVIGNCIEFGLIVKGNYNTTTYDRTCWYALTPKSYWFFPELCDEKYLKLLFSTISPNGEMEYTEWLNQFPETVKPIPYTDPYTDPYILNTPISPFKKISSKKVKEKEKIKSLSVDEMIHDNPNSINKELIEEWLAYRKKPITERIWRQTNKVLRELWDNHGILPQLAFERMLEKQWQGIEVSYFDYMITPKKKPISNQDMDYTLGEHSEFGF